MRKLEEMQSTFAKSAFKVFDRITGYFVIYDLRL